MLNVDQSCRTVALSDLYDDTGDSSSWLFQGTGQQVAEDSRAELRALLSFTSTSDGGARHTASRGGAMPAELARISMQQCHPACSDAANMPQHMQQQGLSANGTAGRQRTASTASPSSSCLPRPSTAQSVGAVTSPAAVAAGRHEAGAVAPQATKEVSDRKLVKCLKKLQQDKQR
jgi:hypothetical protein